MDADLPCRLRLRVSALSVKLSATIGMAIVDFPSDPMTVVPLIVPSALSV